MRGILNEIKNQPPHIREVFMWLCVVITFSVIGFAWFRTTSQQFVALLNPPDINADQVATKPTPPPPSPFANLLVSFKDLTANIATLFDFSQTSKDFEITKQASFSPTPTIPPQTLPLTGEKAKP